MTVSRSATGRAAMLIALCGALAASCAQPGQLGSPAVDPSITVGPAPASAAPTMQAAPVPQLLGSARLDTQITIHTLGAAQFTVRTQVIAPGTSTDWLRNPGTEVSAVQAGGVVLQLAGPGGSCIESPFGSGQAFYVPDAVPYRVRNDGPDPADLVVSRLFAPDFPDPAPVPAPC